jgi:hypothetical protein
MTGLGEYVGALVARVDWRESEIGGGGGGGIRGGGGVWRFARESVVRHRCCAAGGRVERGKTRQLPHDLQR